VVVTASFEGEPADNAGLFVEWIKGMHASEMQGVKFGLFGCGNTDWVTTYQRIPKFIDRGLVERGAERLVDLGEGNAASDSFFEAFDNWEAHLWETLAAVRHLARSFRVGPEIWLQRYNVKAGKDTDILEVTVIGTGTERAIALRQPDAALAKVIENRVLTKRGISEKRHIGKSSWKSGGDTDIDRPAPPPEFELPPNMGYSAGDYLTV
jgi:cytochrome P450/NADPH-cytochrome P450 reductase